jgi:aspartate/tyrosine/aromatic aminotransferase
VLIAASCSKNFGIYRERTGVLIALTSPDRKAVVQGRRPNSVCGLGFSPSHGRTIDDELKKMQHSYETFVKNAKDMNTHHQSKLAAACCCWQGGGVGQEG